MKSGEYDQRRKGKAGGRAPNPSGGRLVGGVGAVAEMCIVMSTGGKWGNRRQEVLEIVMMAKEDDARNGTPLYLLAAMGSREPGRAIGEPR